MTKQQRIEHIKARLRKAYSLPKEEQIKWAKQIHELEMQLAQLQGNTSFNESQAIELLNQANKDILKTCAERRYGGDFYQFLKDNPIVWDHIDQALLGINRAFQLKDMQAFKEAIVQYVAAFTKVEELYQQSRTMGFRELLPSEEKDFQLSIFN